MSNRAYKLPVRLSAAPDKNIRPAVKDGQAWCTECHRPLGTVKGRHLYAGPIILINRAPLRCSSCNTRHVWEPVDHAEN